MRVSYEPVVHIGGVVQSARLMAIRKLNKNQNSPGNKSRSDSSSDLGKPPDQGIVNDEDDDVFLVSGRVNYLSQPPPYHIHPTNA